MLRDFNRFIKGLLENMRDWINSPRVLINLLKIQIISFWFKTGMVFLLLYFTSITLPMLVILVSCFWDMFKCICISNIDNFSHIFFPSKDVFYWVLVPTGIFPQHSDSFSVSHVSLSLSLPDLLENSSNFWVFWNISSVWRNLNWRVYRGFGYLSKKHVSWTQYSLCFFNSLKSKKVQVTNKENLCIENSYCHFFFGLV